MARRDLIAVVESAYDIASSDQQWLRGVTDNFQSVLQAELGVLSYQIAFDDKGPLFSNPVESSDSTLGLVSRIEKKARLLRDGRANKLRGIGKLHYQIYKRMITSAWEKGDVKLLMSEYDLVGPNWMYTLGTPAKDLFILGSYHIDRRDLTVVMGGLRTKRSLTRRQRETYHQLSAHLKAGERLRRRLRPSLSESKPSVELPTDGAVLRADGKLLDADGLATVSNARQALCDEVARLDQARSQKLERAEEALALWQGLVRGQWSLVEKFDRDGKRFIVAHRNPEVSDPRGLSDIECRVVGLALRGYADSLIAYHLGLPQGTVSSHLSAAMRKLAVADRAELVRLLGRHLPAEAPVRVGNATSD